MKLTRTHDMELVESIVRHPAIWPHVRDERAPEDWKPTDDEAIFWMLVQLDDGAPGGVFSVQEVAPGRLEMHTCLLPRVWGRPAAQAARMLVDWAFQVQQCEELGTNVPAYNRLAARFARAGGMHHRGESPASFMKNGVLYAQELLGVSKQEWKSCR